MTKLIKSFPFVETPVQFFESLSDMFGINLYIKRDDLFPEASGGNKARKLQYILKSAKVTGHNAVVTCGDINSNHIRATALMASKIGFKATLVVHNGDKSGEWNSPNVLISRITGARIVYCSKQDIATVMDDEMDKLKFDGFKPYYIWGGGHCLEGSYAYYKAATSLVDPKFDYVIVASGTGTTHAGLHIGFRKVCSNCMVFGISVSRGKKKGTEELYKTVNELEEYLGVINRSTISDINFFDNYLMEGYGRTSEPEEVLIQKIASFSGLLLDPVYTGKAFYGMIDLINNGVIPDKSRVLFWHTGGLNNLIGHLLETKTKEDNILRF